MRPPSSWHQTTAWQCAGAWWGGISRISVWIAAAGDGPGDGVPQQVVGGVDATDGELMLHC